MKYLLITIALCITSFLHAQNPGIIEGKLLDQSNNNEPITFANVAIKGTDITSITDFRGNYVFKDLEPGTYTLQYSFLGYHTKEIEIEVTGDKKEVDAYLEVSEAINFEAIQLAALAESNN
ncbi:carboxypeptidase-like regulatory domain-containing protein [Aquimarina agarilytica]|uniref:carboxypeptidase-like regulatory domain-containing protein n=1 Tax=Aquimarina agarilytica TaxID=1087449 RepID=UPI000288EDFC|nr:carboxypeptidase-like regulatory domain-containing protein [Aquimarina agarilytica]